MDSVESRYAIALLSLAREENKILDYINQCEQLIDIFEKNPDLERILKDYALSKQEKKDTIKLCFDKKIDEYLLNTFYVIIDNKRGNLILPILKEFVRIAYKELNIRKGIVYSTIPLTTSQLKQMEIKVSNMLCSKVSLQNKIDNKILGGFKIQIDDYLIDETIQSRLNDLKETLILKKGE